MPSDSGPVMGGVELTGYPGMRFGDIFGIGVKILEIELGNDLLEKIRDLAERQYGDGGDASVSRVVENALDMRLMLSERQLRCTAFGSRWGRSTNRGLGPKDFVIGAYKQQCSTNTNNQRGE